MFIDGPCVLSHHFENLDASLKMATYDFSENSDSRRRVSGNWSDHVSVVKIRKWYGDERVLLKLCWLETLLVRLSCCKSYNILSGSEARIVKQHIKFKAMT